MKSTCSAESTITLRNCYPVVKKRERECQWHYEQSACSSEDGWLTCNMFGTSLFILGVACSYEMCANHVGFLPFWKWGLALCACRGATFHYVCQPTWLQMKPAGVQGAAAFPLSTFIWSIHDNLSATGTPAEWGTENQRHLTVMEIGWHFHTSSIAFKVGKATVSFVLLCIYSNFLPNCGHGSWAYEP